MVVWEAGFYVRVRQDWESTWVEVAVVATREREREGVNTRAVKVEMVGTMGSEGGGSRHKEEIPVRERHKAQLEGKKTACTCTPQLVPVPTVNATTVPWYVCKSSTAHINVAGSEGRSNRR